MKFYITLALMVVAGMAGAQALWLDELDLSLVETGWGTTRSCKSVEGNQLKVASAVYERGIGTHAVSKLIIRLDGNAVELKAYAGVDDESGIKASVAFYVMGDSKILWQSGMMKKGDPAKPVRVDLKGIKQLALLVTDGGDGIDYDHADWLEAMIVYSGTKPVIRASAVTEPYILTPPPPDKPVINYPRITAAGAGHTLLFSIPASGLRPMTFKAYKLPEGLSLDPSSGIISGKVDKAGRYEVLLTAQNKLGQDDQTLTIVIGDKLALTPPMGWNSWNCWGLSVSDAKIRAAADAMAGTLRQHGWTYINIDDGWEAPKRSATGAILSNEKFPGMKALADYVHAQGLKIGIYSSPGDLTCGGYLGSYGHEHQDALTWESWGIDYLKYDWCSYGKYAANRSREELKKPYLVMRKALDSLGRDIVYSLCQYGMGDVWEWGDSVGGMLWRTTGDITDTWSSMAGIGFRQDKCAPYTRPGNWNDPDMLVTGSVGWGPDIRPSRLTPDEQYTHISLWCLLSAPLLIGGDLSRLDAFNLNLLTNDEVIAVSQDPLGRPARRIGREEDDEVWMKELEDGSVALGMFFTKSDAEGPAALIQWDDQPKSKVISVNLNSLGINGSVTVRDLWSHKDLVPVQNELNLEVRWHGVRFVKLSPIP